MIARVLRKIKKEASIAKRRRALMSQGFSFLAPNYIFLDRFSADSTIVDVGCGSEAEFCIHMDRAYSAKTYGVDPTRKHAEALARIESSTKGRFKHIPKAVASSAQNLTFFESVENESGSIRQDHRNVENDTVRSYEVESLTLTSLREEIGRESVDFLKLDLEGAEYDLLPSVKKEDLLPFQQVFIEFHHHCLDAYSKEDSFKLVERLSSFGLQFVTMDDHNYLFYWGGKVER